MTTGGAWGKAAISQGLTEHGPEIAVGPVDDLGARWPVNSIKNWLRPDHYRDLLNRNTGTTNHSNSSLSRNRVHEIGLIGVGGGFVVCWFND